MSTVNAERSVPVAARLNRDAARAIEHDCARLILDFYDAFDRSAYAEMMQMFTPNGVWNRAGKALTGAGIVAELEQRPASQRVRHIVANVRVDAVDDAHANADFCITAYRGEVSTTQPGGGCTGSLYLLVSVQASFERHDERWRFARQSTVRDFVFPGS